MPRYLATYRTTSRDAFFTPFETTALTADSLTDAHSKAREIARRLGLEVVAVKLDDKQPRARTRKEQ